MVYLTRNPQAPAVSNLIPQGVGAMYQWYTTEYSTTGAQEAFMMPDMGKVGVTISGTYNADVEVTCSPPSRVVAGSGDVWVKPTSPGTVSAATHFTLEGITAFRLKMNSGTAIIEVRV